jgi:hypothetical protein
MMTISTAALLSLLAADPEPVAKPIKPREIVVAGLPTGLGKPMKPQRFKSEKELAAVVTDKTTRAAILKGLDFRKEHLVLFSWAGSGGDRLEPAFGKPTEAAFTLRKGITLDLKQHTKLFAISAKAEPKVITLP